MEIRRTREERATKIALFLGGEDVSRLWVHDLEMRIGNVPVRMGGVGGVRTEEKHRRKGYAGKVIEDAVELMKEKRYDVSVLFGIRDFYPKFGYAVSMAGCELFLRTRYAERASALVTFSPAAESDHEAVRELYEEANSSRTGSVVRRKGAWKGFRQGSHYHAGAKCFVAKGDAGELQAYVVLDENDERTRCAELAARSPEGYEAALRFLAEDAIAKRAGRIRVICPYDHPFVACASRFGVEIEIELERCGGAMGSVIDQRSLFEKLAPLFSERLSSSPLSGRKLAVTVATELGNSTVAFDGREASLAGSDSADVCKMPAAGLMQIAMGYCDAATAGARFEGEIAAEAVGAMFPRQEAHTWWPDRF